MFRATPSIVSVVSSFVAKRRQTMHHVSASPLFIPDGGISRILCAAAHNASGSSGRLTDISLIADSVPLTTLFQALSPALPPLLDTPACQSLPSTSVTRLHQCRVGGGAL